MKSPWEWTEEDIQSMIRNGIKESIDLDYKACASLAKTEGKKDEISKDVSAFANSAGGTIIYGVIEQDNIPVAIDTGYDPTDISREWLEQIINSRIQPRIDDIRINQIELSGANAGKVIYCVNIPQSKRAPHMAHDKRYYKRFNFQSIAMEDYEVKDVSRRLEVPDLEIQYRLLNDKLIFYGDGTFSDSIDISPLITNKSSISVDHSINIQVPP